MQKFKKQKYFSNLFAHDQEYKTEELVLIYYPESFDIFKIGV
jgi:hypothetical protein